MAIKHKDKWSDEKKALKKIQMHFVFKEHLNKRIRHDAADENINPSDVIRKITGLPYRRIQIIKPLDGMGGSSIFRIKEDDVNVGVIIETLTNYGQQYAMVQEYMPEIVDGDKRILIVNGEPMPYCLARIPAKGETRGNLAAGGRGVARPLSPSDKLIADTIAPELKKRGLYFVGLDIIGDKITEINVTSPTCIREIEAAYPINISGKLMDAIEENIRK